jgi:hypothetical protein
MKQNPFSEMFEFIDFEPTTSLMLKAAEKLGRVFSESPSDSNTKASLKKTSRGFEGRMRVHSAVGTFVADIIAEDPLQALELVAQNLRNQLLAWKRERF